ncbi:DNA repair protein RadC [Sphingobacteriaceae bacterium WQ 2009]|uniref:DNA repair protein RadC n=2 Tax=Rhinopithecimicrobium faecis TaxID=2820698 RepID=A0A8T4HBH7_9SPHI|nr:DNA repair protein RadC [Sphingobacteriaceae bacterium WQ 2009]
MGKMRIRSWPKQDRPREKLKSLGRRSLTDAELIAILIGSGSKQESALALSKRILQAVDNDLQELAKLSDIEFCEFSGVGPAKAFSIIAALELGRRKRTMKFKEQPTLNSAKLVFEYFNYQFNDLQEEEFWVIYLNTACKVVDFKLIGRGGNDFTPVDIRTLLKYALTCQAHAVILTHNHPSGSLKASEMDLKLTHKIVQAARLMDIVVNDHIIFTNQHYYSFRDQGLL